MAQVALAWVASKSAASAPIIGATKPHHLDDAIAALDIRLTDDEIRQFEVAFSPRTPTGFWRHLLERSSCTRRQRPHRS